MAYLVLDKQIHPTLIFCFLKLEILIGNFLIIFFSSNNGIHNTDFLIFKIYFFKPHKESDKLEKQ
jgi:hypothetical protein